MNTCAFIIHMLRYHIYLILFGSICIGIQAREAINVGQVLDDTVHMLEQVDPAMAAQMKNITPDQQKELERQLNVVFDKMGTMTPEELKYLEQHPEAMFDFVEKTVAEETPQEKPIAALPSDTPRPEEKPADVPKSAPTRPTQETLKVSDLLAHIIHITDEFLIKLTDAHLETRIDRWAEKNKIKNWQAGLRYKKFQEQLTSLNKKLRIIQQERDLETQRFVYIDLLTNNNALLTSLQRLNNTLTTQWAITVFPSEEDIDSLVVKLSRETKNALRAMLGAYAQALLTIPSQLDALMKEYSPRAETLREKEAKLTEEGKKRKYLPSSPMQGLGTSGYGRGRGDYYPSDYSGYTPYYGGDYSGYEPNYGTSGGTSPDARDQEATKKAADSGKKEADKDKKDEEEKKLAGVTPKERKERAHDLIQEDIKEFEECLTTAHQALQVHELMLRDPQTAPQAAHDAFAIAFGDIIKKVSCAHRPLGHIEHELRILDKKEKENTAKKVARLWKTHKEFFTELSAKIPTTVPTPVEVKKTTPKRATSKPKRAASTVPSAVTEQKLQTVDTQTEVTGEDIRRLFGEPLDTQEEAIEIKPTSQDVAIQTEPLAVDTDMQKETSGEPVPEDTSKTKLAPETEKDKMLATLKQELQSLISHCDTFIKA